MAKFTSPIPLDFEYEGHPLRGPAGTVFRIPDSLRAAFDAEFGTRVSPSWTVNDEIANGGGSAAAHPDLGEHVALGLVGTHDHDGSYEPPHAHPYAATVHTHPQSAVTNLVSDLSGKAATVHTHAQSSVTNLVSDLAGKAATVHTHAISSTTNLQSTLDGKAALVHTQPYSTLTSLPSTFPPDTHSHVDGDLPAGLARDSEVTSAIDVHAATPHGGSLPAGLIVMWGGAVSAIPSGWLLCNGSNGTPDLRDRFIKGAANGADPGATGGSATHTHAGHSDHAALTHAGAAVADHAAHTHTYTQVVNHVHNQTRLPTATGGVTGFTVDTSMSGTPATSGVDTGNPTGGVATGTTANPSATLTHGVTQPSQHAAQSHSAHDTPNSEPAFYALCFIQKS